MNGTRKLSPADLDASVRARFDAKHRPDENGCWIWTAARKANGYGTFGIGPARDNHMYYAHRVSYTMHVGEIPNGLHVDHLCRVREPRAS